MRILKLVNSCGECDNRQYYSGGVHHCKLVKEPIRDDSRVAAFCPLTIYPSGTIAGLEATLHALQKEKNSHGLHFELFSYVAAKLKARLSSDFRLIHLIKRVGEKEEDLYLVLDRIAKVNIEQSAVYFMAHDNPEKQYKVTLGLEVRLSEVGEFEGREETTAVHFRPAS